MNAIQEKFGTPDIIAGVATGGIAIGALVAQEMGIPYAYVRSEAKKHGLGNQVEGVVEPNQKVVVIEDLISTGKSSLSAVTALREAGLDVMGMVAIFTYDFDIAKEAFKELHTLTDYHALLQQALKKEYITEEQLSTLKVWRENPAAWSAAYLESNPNG